MITSLASSRAGALAVAMATGLLASGALAAQTMDHAGMVMPQAPTTDSDRQNTGPAKPSQKHKHAAPTNNASDQQSPSPSMEAMDHAAMGHAMPADSPPGDPPMPPGMSMPGSGTKPDSSMQGMTMEGMDHAAMGHSATTSEPRTPIPKVTDIDRAAAVPPPSDHPVHDNTIQHYVLFNRLEAWNADPGTGQAWEGQSWIGTDLNRLWLRSEGERNDGRTEAADLEVLYGRSVAPWWDLVAGVRQDFKPGSSQTYAAFGVQGLAPMKFEVAATAYIGERGQTAARFEAEYELLLTNRWILQPLAEIELFGKDDPARGIGSGLSTAEVGLRLRYEFTRQFAPYIGLVYEGAFGNTADLRRDESERVDDTRIVVGIRTWF
ncbi:copper resistance protein B [Xanthomonas citri pv. citri]|nr:copper resistance protein B [Xanthomonas citri]